MRNPRQQCLILKSYDNGEQKERESRKLFSLNRWVKQGTEQRV